MRRIRVLIADDHALMRQGLHDVCVTLGGFLVVAEAAGGEEAVVLHRVLRPDVTLMDLSMPDLGGVATIRRIVAESPAARILALTMYYDEARRHAAMQAGARGYLLKTVHAEDLVAAILAIHRGDRLDGTPLDLPPR